MASKKPEVLKSSKPYAGTIVDIRADEVRYPDGHVGRREVVEHPGGAVVVPILPDGRVLLIRQYRHPVKSYILELPAGKLEKDEPPETCAMRELEEETGYTATRLRHLTSMLTTPGFCDERLHIFLAEPVHASFSGQRLEPGESLLTVEPTLWNDAVRMIHDGTIIDGKTIVGIYLTDLRRRA